MEMKKDVAGEIEGVQSPMLFLCQDSWRSRSGVNADGWRTWNGDNWASWRGGEGIWSRRVLYKCLYFDFERAHLCRKLGIWVVYPTLIIMVIIAMPIWWAPTCQAAKELDLIQFLLQPCEVWILLFPFNEEEPEHQRHSVICPRS